MEIKCELVVQLQDLLTDDDLLKALSVLPLVKSEFKNKGERLIASMDIYRVYIPNKTIVAIYNALYLSVVCSLKKKNSIEEIKLLNDNYASTLNEKRYGVIGGLDSFRITGNSGVGKTSAVHRCIDVITRGKVIKVPNSNREIIPILVIECPADGSFKNLLYSIMQKIDSDIGSNYFEVNSSKTVTTDYLLNAVSTILINHVGLLIIDEIERVANDSVRGETMINYLTQMVNQTNTSICFVGSQNANAYFSTKEYMGRRTIGINLNKMNFDKEFYVFCETLFQYQYTSEKAQPSNEIIKTLYSFSNGLPSMVISLFAEAQKKAIIEDIGCINSDLIKEVFDLMFSNVAPYIKPKKETKKIAKIFGPETSDEYQREALFVAITNACKKDVSRAISMLNKKIEIDYVKL